MRGHNLWSKTNISCMAEHTLDTKGFLITIIVFVSRVNSSLTFALQMSRTHLNG